MTPEERNLLERTHKLVEENNQILVKMRRSNRYALVFRVLYWVVIIGISFGAFYLIQPYINAITGGGTTQQSDLGTIGMIKDLLQ